MVIYFADAFSRGEIPADKLKSNESLQPAPFDDFIYLSVSRILMKFTFLLQFFDGDNNLKYPIHVASLRLTYISRPDLLGTPTMDKREAEDKLLSQFFIDLHLSSVTKHDLKQHMPGITNSQFDDELSTGLRQLAAECQRLASIC